MEDYFAGVETWYADGSGQIAVTDRFAYSSIVGELHIPYSYPFNGVRYVTVPGMKNDGTWYVSATGNCTITIFDGYFRYERFEFQAWPQWPVAEVEGPYVYYTVTRI